MPAGHDTTRHDTRGAKKKGGDDELAGDVQASLAIQTLSFPTRPRPNVGSPMDDGMSCLAASMEYLWEFGPLAGRPGDVSHGHTAAARVPATGPCLDLI